MVDPFSPHTTENYDVKTAQDQVEEFTRPLVDNPTLKGVYLEGIELDAGSINVIEHKLNRQVRGWWPVRVYDADYLIPDNMIAVCIVANYYNELNTHLWWDFDWEFHPVVGPSFEHTLDTPVITINDPGEYIACSGISWERQTTAGGTTILTDRFVLSRDGGAWETMNTAYLRFGAKLEPGTHGLVAGFSLAPADVPAQFKLQSTRRTASATRYLTMPYGGDLTIQSVGNIKGTEDSFVPFIREEIDDNDDPIKYLQLLTDVGCTVDLWVW